MRSPHHQPGRLPADRRRQYRRNQRRGQCASAAFDCHRPARRRSHWAELEPIVKPARDLVRHQPLARRRGQCQPFRRPLDRIAPGSQADDAKRDSAAELDVVAELVRNVATELQRTLCHRRQPIGTLKRPHDTNRPGSAGPHLGRARQSWRDLRPQPDRPMVVRGRGATRQLQHHRHGECRRVQPRPGRRHDAGANDLARLADHRGALSARPQVPGPLTAATTTRTHLDAKAPSLHPRPQFSARTHCPSRAPPRRAPCRPR